MAIPIITAIGLPVVAVALGAMIWTGVRTGKTLGRSESIDRNEDPFGFYLAMGLYCVMFPLVLVASAVVIARALGWNA